RVEQLVITAVPLADLLRDLQRLANARAVIGLPETFALHHRQQRVVVADKVLVTARALLERHAQYLHVLGVSRQVRHGTWSSIGVQTVLTTSSRSPAGWRSEWRR